MIERDGHREYACVQCGHPLVFQADHDPYGESAIFNKKVRYLCGLFGHRVHVVVDRDGFREFACHCGHSFLKPEGDQHLHIKHPAICVAAGIASASWRAGLASRSSSVETAAIRSASPMPSAGEDEGHVGARMQSRWSC